MALINALYSLTAESLSSRSTSRNWNQLMPDGLQYVWKTHIMVEIIRDDRLWGLSQESPKDRGDIVGRKGQCLPIEVLAELEIST
jgi:hypothetical protein